MSNVKSFLGSVVHWTRKSRRNMVIAIIAVLVSVGMVAAAGTFAKTNKSGSGKSSVSQKVKNVPTSGSGTIEAIVYVDKENGGKRHDARLGGVRVTAKKIDGGKGCTEKRGKTNANKGKNHGVKHFTNCSPGKYRISAKTRDSYEISRESKKRKTITLPAGQTRRVKFTFWHYARTIIIPGPQLPPEMTTPDGDPGSDTPQDQLDNQTGDNSPEE